MGSRRSPLPTALCRFLEFRLGLRAALMKPCPAATSHCALSPCELRGVGLSKALISAGKAQTESHCLQDEVTAVGWQLGLQFCF